MSKMQFPSDWPARLIFGGLGGLTLIVVRGTQLNFYYGAPREMWVAG